MTWATPSDYINTWLQTVGVPVGSISRDAGIFVVPWAWLDDDAIEECWRLAAAMWRALLCGPRWRFPL